MDPESQIEQLAQNVMDFHSREELLEKLKQGRPLRIKYGADPSAPDLHLGHSVPLRKLRQFQELGHIIVFIIGDFTGMIGDPSGRSKTRPMLTRQEIEANARTYAEQVDKILDVDRCEIRYNSEWFRRMQTTELLAIASHYTVARMLERDDFAQRMEREVPVSVLELMYPLIQAYDSVAIEADVEIGGTDQLFNFLVAREIMRAYDMTPQVVMTWPLLVGTDGTAKMSKSLGNYIGIAEEPNVMFGKLMSISDDMMFHYYRLLLDTTDDEIEQMQGEIEEGRNPRELKAELGRRIVETYYDGETAQEAEKEFDRVHAEHKLPSEMPEVNVASEVDGGQAWIVKLVTKAGFAESNSEARRLIRQGGVRVNDERIEDETANIAIGDGDVLQVGRRRFARLVVD